MNAKAEGKYNQDDIMLFASPGDRTRLKNMGIYTGTRVFTEPKY